MSKCFFGCGRTLKPNSKLESCQTCRNSMGRMIRNGAYWLKKRIDRLKLYSNRAENVAAGDKKVW